MKIDSFYAGWATFWFVMAAVDASQRQWFWLPVAVGMGVYSAAKAVQP